MRRDGASKMRRDGVTHCKCRKNNLWHARTVMVQKNLRRDVAWSCTVIVSRRDGAWSCAVMAQVGHAP